MQRTPTATADAPNIFNMPKPMSIRIWHWFTVLFFLSSITMVLLASTMFKTNNNISLVQQEAQQKGGILTSDQAMQVAHMYSDKLWMTHKYIGYGLCILLLWRLMIEGFMTGTGRLLKRLHRVSHAGITEQEAKHYQWVQYSYTVFYIIFILMALTGLILAFEDVKWLDPLHKPAQSLHSFLQYLLYAYALLHIAGVLRADMNRYPGIVSRMIHGKKI